MNIEITKDTFELIFNQDLMYQSTDSKELANKFYYYNSKLEQKGIMIHNFIGDIFQYYLTDINA